jgi:hypothetical protein
MKFVNLPKSPVSFLAECVGANCPRERLRHRGSPVAEDRRKRAAKRGRNGRLDDPAKTSLEVTHATTGNNQPLFAAHAPRVSVKIQFADSS